MGWGPIQRQGNAALPSSTLAGVMSASLRTTSSDSRSPTNKPLALCLIWG